MPTRHRSVSLPDWNWNGNDSGKDSAAAFFRWFFILPERKIQREMGISRGCGRFQPHPTCGSGSRGHLPKTTILAGLKVLGAGSLVVESQ